MRSWKKNRLKKQKVLELNNKRFAAGLPPLPAAPVPKASTAQRAPRATGATAAKGETPAKAFERIFAPIFIPPAVAQKRPELVKQYQASSTPKTSARVTTSRVTKKAPRTVAKPRVTKSAVRKATSARGVVKPT